MAEALATPRGVLDLHPPSRCTLSAVASDRSPEALAGFWEWWGDRQRTGAFDVASIPFAELDQWNFDERTGNLAHRSGRFFTVEGLRVTDAGILAWTQPVLYQPEIGILGILAGLYATRVSREATRTSREMSRETNQIKWLQEAKDDAAQAKKDSREAREEADEVRDDLAETKRDLAQAKRELTEQRDLNEELTRWALRAVTWAADPTIDREEIRRLINGGPPSLRGILGRPAGE